MSFSSNLFKLLRHSIPFLDSELVIHEKLRTLFTEVPGSIDARLSLRAIRIRSESILKRIAMRAPIHKPFPKMRPRNASIELQADLEMIRPGRWSLLLLHCHEQQRLGRKPLPSLLAKRRQLLRVLLRIHRQNPELVMLQMSHMNIYGVLIILFVPNTLIPRHTLFPNLPSSAFGKDQGSDLFGPPYPSWTGPSNPPPRGGGPSAASPLTGLARGIGRTFRGTENSSLYQGMGEPS